MKIVFALFLGTVMVATGSPPALQEPDKANLPVDPNARQRVPTPFKVAMRARKGVETFPKPGEWPAYRRDGSLQARSTARGTITSPRIVWRQFVGVIESLVVVQPDHGKDRLTLPRAETAPTSASGNFPLRNFIPTPDSPDDERSSPTVVYADVLPGEPGKEKIEFESGFSKPTVNGQWQKCVGRCFARRGGQWVQVWETQPIDYLFQSLPLVGDFDGDGQPEVAILPFYELLLLDARTGAIKHRCRFTDTRSYGFFGAYDFDHDGRFEFLVQADFSKHVDVLGFRDGKLGVLWQRAIELDISDPKKILRVGPNPTADVDGDGQPEIFTTLFNERICYCNTDAVELQFLRHAPAILAVVRCHADLFALAPAF